MSRKWSLNFKYGSWRKPSSKQPQGQAPSDPPTPTPTQVFQQNVAEMRQVFDKFDTNKDGRISPEEYKSALRGLQKVGNAEKEASTAFEVLDTDGDGFIDFKEFMEVHNMGGGVKRSEIQSAFEVFDLDGDGKISAKELMEVMKGLGEQCSLKSCRKMVKAVDRDGDGMIDIDEFMTMMTNTLKLSSS